MQQPPRSNEGSLGAAMALRGGRWGTVAGVACGLLAAGILAFGGNGPFDVLGVLAVFAFAAGYAVVLGALAGLGLGFVGGGLLGWWTGTHPRPVDARAGYRRRATPVVGLLMGVVVALALSIPAHLWASQPPHLARQEVLYAAIVAVEAGLAAGWCTCQLLGWYADRVA